MDGWLLQGIIWAVYACVTHGTLSPLTGGLDDYEYFVSAYTAMTWYDGEEECMKAGGHLITIEDQSETDLVVQAMSGPSTNFWIGLNSLKSGNVWRWSGGETFSYTNWDDGYPRYTDTIPQLCATVNSNTAGRWQTAQCAGKAGFFCRRRSDQGGWPIFPPVPAPIPGPCPQDYFGVGDRCYRIFTNEYVTWSDALKKCQSVKVGRWPSLASFQDLVDNDGLKSRCRCNNAAVTVQLAASGSGAGKVWIGLYDSGYKWYWADNSPNDWTNWYSDFFIDMEGKCAYVQTNTDGRWLPADCEQKHGYVCQTYKDGDIDSTLAPPYENEACPTGYLYYRAACYKFYDRAANWSDAEQACNRDNATLASIHSDPENAAIFLLLNSQNSSAWLGLKKEASLGLFTMNSWCHSKLNQTANGSTTPARCRLHIISIIPADDPATKAPGNLQNSTWSWSDSTYTVFTKWGEEVPAETPDEIFCVEMGTSDSRWDGVSCLKTQPYVCKISLQNETERHPDTAGTCPPNPSGFDWIDNPNEPFCYGFPGKGGVPWESALSKCSRSHTGASLVSIHSAEENAFIYDHATAADIYTNTAWLGLFRSQIDGTYMWTDTSAVAYEPWAAGYPRNDKGECVMMGLGTHLKARSWVNEPCDRTHQVVCKVPKVPPVEYPPDEPGYCPDEENWERYGSDCLLFHLDRVVNWQSAKKECVSLGADLVTVEDAVKNDFLKETSHRISLVRKYFWLGLHRRDAGSEFLWTSTQQAPQFVSWADDTVAAFSTNCATMASSTTNWYYEECPMTHGFVCQVAKTPTKPMPSTTSGEVVEEDATHTGGLSGGDVAGIVVGCLLMFALVGIAVYYVIQKPSSRQLANAGGGIENPNYRD